MGNRESVGEYIDSFVGPARSMLCELRDLSRTAAPDATEELKWGEPAYVHQDGVILFLFAGFSKHANFAFTPSTRAAFADELTGFGTGKGTVKLPYTDPVPTGLLTRMIVYRIRELEIEGVKWM